MNKTVIALIVGIVIISTAAVLFLYKKDNEKIPNITKGDQSNGLNITPVDAKYSEITITSDAVMPLATTIDKSSLIHFINKTNKTVEIVSTGDNKIIIAPIEGGKTGITLLFPNSGTYEFIVKGDNTRKGTITVK